MQSEIRGNGLGHGNDLAAVFSVWRRSSPITSPAFIIPMSALHTEWDRPARNICLIKNDSGFGKVCQACRATAIIVVTGSTFGFGP
jgi:hypothetical protein